MTLPSAAALLETLRVALVAKVSGTRFPRYVTLERQLLPPRPSRVSLEERKWETRRGGGGDGGAGVLLRTCIDRRGVVGTSAACVSEQIVERFAEIAAARAEERAEQLVQLRGAAGALAVRVAAVDKRCAAVRAALRRLEVAANAIERA